MQSQTRTQEDQVQLETTTQNSELPVVQSDLSDNSFQVKITAGGQTLSHVFDDTLGGITYVEDEAKTIYESIKKFYVHPEALDPTMLLALSPLAEKYLELISKQAENKIKVINAAGNIIKTQTPLVNNNNLFGQFGQSQDQTPDVYKILDNAMDPLAESYSESPKPRATDDMNSGMYDYHDEVLSKFDSVDDDDVIHSPDYLKMRKNGAS